MGRRSRGRRRRPPQIRHALRTDFGVRIDIERYADSVLAVHDYLFVKVPRIMNEALAQALADTAEERP